MFTGVIEGLIVAVMAMGIVLVYRSSRVINYAAGELGVPAAALLAVMVTNDHIPYWIAFVVVIGIGIAAGGAVELLVIRRLSAAPRVIVLVATIGIFELAQTITVYLPGYRRGDIPPTFPTPISSHWNIGTVRVDGADLLVLLVVPIVTIGLWLLLGHSRFGEAVRASATNVDLARLTGINPKLVASAIWAIAGLLSTLSVVLWATTHSTGQVISIGPDTLLFALAAALIGGMRSFPRTFIGAIAIGLLEQYVSFHWTDVSGLTSFILFIAILVLIARSRRADDSGAESFAFAPRVPAVPERMREIWWVRRMPQLFAGGAFFVAIVIPLVITSSSHQFVYATILGWMICAVSVTVLTGWAGQLSLGQMAFAGVGALLGAAFQRGLSLNIGWHSTRIINGSLPPLPFGVSVLLGAVCACLCAVIVGIGALHVRGLLLAISTLAFAIAAGEYLFFRPLFSGGEFSDTVVFARGHLGPFDLTHRNRAYYYAMLLALVVVLAVAARVRKTGIGRTIIGVRENEPAAAALTVSPTRTKLTAFGMGGFFAGLGGAALGALVPSISFTGNLFRVEDCLTLVSLAVIGGIGSLSGAVVGALWVIGLQAFWPSNPTVQLLTSNIGLLIVLLYVPGGFAQVGYWIRDLVFRWLEPQLAAKPAKTVTEPPVSLASTARAATATCNADGSVLATHGLTVMFGGLTAVDRVDFHAQPGEIVGLIGTNGAGKSTLLNAIGGFLPSTGTVELLGRPVQRMPAHKRARVGLGRTFQAATLFPELTVRETVELGLEARAATSFWGTVTFSPLAARAERAKRAEASELIDFLGLGRYADRFIAELSTGTRRIVELAAVLAVAPRVILLDEPTAGVAQREAEAFGPLIRRVQQELDATLVIVEHDLPLILGLSDRVYCLEAGRVIAHGSPADVRADGRVIASYLGTDERAIERSNATST